MPRRGRTSLTVCALATGLVVACSHEHQGAKRPNRHWEHTVNDSPRHEEAHPKRRQPKKDGDERKAAHAHHDAPAAAPSASHERDAGAAPDAGADAATAEVFTP